MITFLIFYFIFSAFVTYGIGAEYGEFKNISYIIAITKCLLLGWIIFTIMLGRYIGIPFK